MLDLDKLSYLKKDKSEDGIQGQKQIAKNKKDLETVKRMIIYLRCNYCKTPLLSRIYSLKFAGLEQFFCCNECRSAFTYASFSVIHFIIQEKNCTIKSTNNRKQD
jgi:ribosomal protein L44E